MIESVPETGSTNADLAARLRAGEDIPEGFWLRADLQTQGRGRQAREWVSPPGNLHCSTIVLPDPSDPPPHTLSFVAALAVDDLLAGQLFRPDFGAPRLKWPNDVLVSGAKIAGILLERLDKAVIVGIGVNVAHAPQVTDRTTTAIQIENARNDNSAQQVLDYLVPHFAARLAQWRSKGQTATLADWLERAHPVGTRLIVDQGGAGELSGAFAGLTQDGALRLRLDGGDFRVIHAGDVNYG